MRHLSPASTTEHESTNSKYDHSFVLLDHLETEAHREGKCEHDDDPRDADEYITEDGADRFIVGRYILHRRW